MNLADEIARYQLHQNDPADLKYRTFLNKLVEPCASRVHPGSWGLDFGCGPGPCISVMMKELHNLHVVDWDLNFLSNPALPPDFPERLKINMKKNQSESKVDVLRVQYDFVTCTEVIEHIPQPLEVFQQFDALLVNVRPSSRIPCKRLCILC